LLDWVFGSRSSRGLWQAAQARPPRLGKTAIAFRFEG
jgi:hypothetical protein